MSLYYGGIGMKQEKLYRLGIHNFPLKVILFALSAAFVSSMVMIQSYEMGQIVEHVTDSVKDVLTMFLIIVCTMVIEIVGNSLQSYYVNHQLQVLQKTLQVKYGKKILNADYQQLESQKEGYLLSLFQSDIFQIQNYTRFLFNIGSIPLKVIVPIVFLVIKSYQLALAILVVSPLLLLPGLLIQNKQYQQNVRLQKANDIANHNFLNLLGILKLIKAFHREEEFEKQNNVFLEQYQKEKNHLFSISMLFQTINRVLGVLPIVTLYLVGAIFVMQGKITVGDIIAIALFIGVLSDGIGGIQQIPFLKKQYKLAKQRLESVFEMKEQQNNEFQSLDTEERDLLMEFKHVSFSYNESQKILKDINLQIHKSEKILLEGENGSGKSTLFRLMEGLYQPETGTIQVVNRRDKGFCVSVVGQESILFAKNIKENVTIVNPDLLQEEYEKICEITMLTDVIHQHDERMIGEGGNNYSKGQLQRVNLARGLAKNADLYLLDEPTSGLDAKMQQKVTQQILAYLEDKAVIWISHTQVNESLFDTKYTLQDGVLYEK